MFQVHVGRHLEQVGREDQGRLDVAIQGQQGADLVVELLDSRGQLVLETIGGGDGGDALDDVPVDHHQPHIGLLELEFVLFDDLDLNRMDAVVAGHLLVFAGRLAHPFGLGAHVVEVDPEVLLVVEGVFAEQVAQVDLGGVVGRGQVPGEKHLDGQRLGERLGDLHTDRRKRVDAVLGQVAPEEEADARDVDQYDDQGIEPEFDILGMAAGCGFHFDLSFTISLPSTDGWHTVPGKQRSQSRAGRASPRFPWRCC